MATQAEIAEKYKKLTPEEQKKVQGALSTQQGQNIVNNAL
jgi:hypothetical protein